MFLVALAGWFLPGGGYLVLKETSRALIIFVTIVAIFAAGLYIGSIGVVDPIRVQVVVYSADGEFAAGGDYRVSYQGRRLPGFRQAQRNGPDIYQHCGTA